MSRPDGNDLGSADLGSADTLGVDPASAETQAADLAGSDTLAATPGPPLPAQRGEGRGGGPVLPVVSRDHYEILGEHDRGGLGRILRARDRRTGRVVAIKEVLRSSEETAARFQREALVTANLQHPAIVPVYEVGCWPDGQPFYAMKLVSGRSLAEAIKQATSRDDRLALLPHVIAAADALAYAHDRGFIHRDLKPSNVLVGAFGETVVIDWGLATAIGDASGTGGPGETPGAARRPDAPGPRPSRPPIRMADLTADGAVLGTPAYMAPEQARGADVDARADVYALGAMLYHLLGGRMPYADSKSIDELLSSLRAGPPRPLPELDPDLPPDLVAIAGKAMAHDPAARYDTAGALAEDLRRFTTGQLVRAHDYSTGQLLRRWIARHKAAVLVGAAALVALTAIGAYGIAAIRNQRDAALAERDAKETALVEEAAARADAVTNQAALYETLGRQELDVEQPTRALAYLAEAARIRPAIDSGLAHLIGRALEAFAPLRWMAETAEDDFVIIASPAPESGRVLTTTRHGPLQVREVRTGRVLASIRPGFEIYDAGLSPDGRWLAAVSVRGSAFVTWQVDGGAELRRVSRTPKQDGINAIDVSPDGRHVATGDASAELAIWTPDGSEPVRRWRASRKSSLMRVAWVPRAAEILSIELDGEVAVWNANTGTRRLLLAGEPANFDSISPRFTADGSHVLIIDASLQRGRVHRLKDGAVVARLEHPVRRQGDTGARIAEAFMAPDGSRVLTTGHDTDPVLWEVPGGRPVAALPGHAQGGWVNGLIAGDLAITGDGTGTLRMWDARTGALRTRLHPPAQRATAAMTAIGDVLVVGSLEGRLHAWDLTAPATCAVLAGDDREETRRAVYLGDTGLLASGSRGGTLRVWDSTSGRMLHTIERAHVGRIGVMSSHRDGKRLATGGADGIVRVWDAPAGKLLHELRHGVPLVGVHWLAGDALASAGEDGTIRTWDGAGGRALCASRTPGPPLFGAEASPDGATLLGLGSGPRSALWGTRDCGLRHVIETGHKASLRAAFAADGTLAVIGGSVNTDSGIPAALAIDPASGSARPLPAETDLVGDVIFAPDGRTVAVPRRDGSVALFDRDSLRIRTVLIDATAMATAVAFTPDGELLLAGDADGLIRVWDWRNGRRLSTFRGHRPGVYWLRVRADGRQLASAALESTVRMWSLPRFEGTLSSLDALVRCRVPWQVSGGELVARVLDPAACGP